MLDMTDYRCHCISWLQKVHMCVDTPKLLHLFQVGVSIAISRVCITHLIFYNVAHCKINAFQFSCVKYNLNDSYA